MQTLGTEWARNLLDENIWVDVVRRKIKALDSYSVVVTDVRFQNEAALIKELGGVILQVQREGLDGVGIQGHSSEVGRGVHADFVVVNDGTLDQLKEKVLCAIDEVLEPFLIHAR
uniref:deoxynucleotide monophosphate kinase family protein n=1 Tax=Cecembia sp. TaxID=1898110 RepID=UPI0025C6BA94